MSIHRFWFIRITPISVTIKIPSCIKSENDISMMYLPFKEEGSATANGNYSTRHKPIQALCGFELLHHRHPRPVQHGTRLVVRWNFEISVPEHAVSGKQEILGSSQFSFWSIALKLCQFRGMFRGMFFKKILVFSTKYWKILPFSESV